MTFLPIVERELRVAARRRATYWSRLMMALVAMIIGACVLLVNVGASQTVLGKFVFTALAVLALVYCLASGRRSTADCLSEEKREGTLGLLFLTDLNGYDIVLGKLVATSLNAFYGLLAVFPVLAIPLLLGGITSGEFWRIVLVLLNTFLFSLAIGIFSSALTHDARRAMALNFALIFFFTAALPAFALTINLTSRTFIPASCYTSPIFCFWQSFAIPYKADHYNFWWSLAIIHGLTWLLLIQASRIVPRSWQDQPAPAPRTAKARRQSLWHTWNYGHTIHHAPFRKKLLDVNAFYWLAARARLKPLHVWTFLVLLGLWWTYVHFAANGVVDDFVDIMMALLLNATLKLWIALEAGQRLAEDKKIGSLELILSTPLGVRDIVHGQMLALRRQFFLPTLVVILLALYLLMDAREHTIHPDPEMVFTWLCAILLLVADLVTLSWVAMAKALTVKTHNQSIIVTVFYVLILPWIAFGMAMGFLNLWYNLTSFGGPPGLIIHWGWLFVFGLLADIFFGLRACHLLLDGMRPLAAQRFAFSSTLAEAKPPPPKNRARKLLLRYAAALALLLVWAWFFWPHPAAITFPPPLVVPVSLSQGSLQVFPSATGALFILPDGSLWRCGQTGATLPRTSVPEQLGTNQDWLQVASSPMGLVGIRKDGTLWQQVQQNVASRGELVPVDEGHDWVAVTTAGMHSCALKRDGTLWAWGNNQFGQLGNGPGPNQTNVVQVGTNNDWADVVCSSMATLALRTNGTLWAWGPAYYFGSPTLTLNRIALPTQICRESNWIGFANGVRTVQVRNRQGELWEPFFAAPNPDLGASATCQLAIPNRIPDHVALAYCGQSKVFEIRSDGTLWEKNYAPGNPSTKTADKWRQVGKRSDWRSLWAGGGTAFGLTSDGTIWTWGVDLNRAQVVDFSARFKLLQARIMGGFGALSPGARMGSPVAMNLQYQKNPRPLMQLSPTAQNPAIK